MSVQKENAPLTAGTGQRRNQKNTNRIIAQRPSSSKEETMYNPVTEATRKIRVADQWLAYAENRRLDPPEPATQPVTPPKKLPRLYVFGVWWEHFGG